MLSVLVPRYVYAVAVTLHGQPLLQVTQCLLEQHVMITSLHQPLCMQELAASACSCWLHVQHEEVRCL